MIRPATILDATQICGIYNHHVTHTTVTFEEEPVTEDEMKRRIHTISSGFPWLVYEQENIIMGYAYATEWRSRSAYRYTAESTVYIKEDHKGRGIGQALYEYLINEIKKLLVRAVFSLRHFD